MDGDSQRGDRRVVAFELEHVVVAAWRRTRCRVDREAPALPRLDCVEARHVLLAAMRQETHGHWSRLVASECQLATHALSLERGEEDSGDGLDLDRGTNCSDERERYQRQLRIVRLDDSHSADTSLHTTSRPFHDDRPAVSRYYLRR